MKTELLSRVARRYIEARESKAISPDYNPTIWSDIEVKKGVVTLQDKTEIEFYLNITEAELSTKFGGTLRVLKGIKSTKNADMFFKELQGALWVFGGGKTNIEKVLGALGFK